MSLTKRTLCAIAALALLAGGAVYATTTETAPSGKLTVTYFYLPG